MKPSLYFVRADDEDLECLDLLVIAETEAQAEALWGSHFEFHFDMGVRPMWTCPVPGVTPDAPIGVIHWDTINPDPMR